MDAINRKVEEIRRAETEWRQRVHVRDGGVLLPSGTVGGLTAVVGLSSLLPRCPQTATSEAQSKDGEIRSLQEEVTRLTESLHSLREEAQGTQGAVSLLAAASEESDSLRRQVREAADRRQEAEERRDECVLPVTGQSLPFAAG